MVSIVVTIHIIVCVSLVVIILLQQGKGAEIGAVFGGSSQTQFGTSGQGNMLTKTTWAMAALFFATSIFLAYASTRRVTGSIFGSGAGSVMGKKVAMPAKPPMPAGPAAPAAPAAPAGPANTAPQPKH